jgi:hypothetical protein
LREEGYLEELRKKWWYDKSQCSKHNSEKAGSKVFLFYLFTEYKMKMHFKTV